MGRLRDTFRTLDWEGIGVELANFRGGYNYIIIIKYKNMGIEQGGEVPEQTKDEVAESYQKKELITDLEDNGELGSKIETKEAILKESVNFVFKQNSELLSVGTQEQYIEYIGTIFPASIFKEIAYHGSDADFKDEGFKPIKPNFNTRNSISGVYSFTDNKEFAQKYGKNIYAVVLDVHNPTEESSPGSNLEDMDEPIDKALIKIGKIQANNLEVAVGIGDEKLNNIDGVINHISGKDYFNKHPKTGREYGLPRQTIITVFHENQTHILGSKADIQKFKEFISNHQN